MHLGAHPQQSHKRSVVSINSGLGGLPKYEAARSILQQDETITSIPMITSKNDDEYDYVLVIKDNQNTAECVDHRSTRNHRKEIMDRLELAELMVSPEKHRIGDLYLIRIRADDELLEEWAEKMHLLMRLDGSGVYAPFQRGLKSQFQITSFFPDSVFRSSERQLIIHEILHRKQWENGVELNEEILPSIVYMYPLHINNRKNELYWKWNHGYNQWERIQDVDNRKAIMNAITKLFNFLWPTQPLNDIVEYFGEEVGFYFALVEYFIKWLYAPSIGGTVIFFVQMKQSRNGVQCHRKVEGQQDAEGNLLNFDIQTCDAMIPYFSVFMCIWTTLFIQFWKRRQTKLAHQWGVLDYEAKDIANGDRNRLSYKGRGEIDGDRIIDKVTMEHVLKVCC